MEKEYYPMWAKSWTGSQVKRWADKLVEEIGELVPFADYWAGYSKSLELRNLIWVSNPKGCYVPEVFKWAVNLHYALPACLQHQDVTELLNELGMEFKEGYLVRKERKGNSQLLQQKPRGLEMILKPAKTKTIAYQKD